MSILIIIILWLIFGSFGSVIFFRLGDFPHRKTFKSFLIWRSECQNCHHTLHRIDLVPLASFLSQKGKCRYCKSKLSRRYPIIEFGTVVIFLSVFFLLTSGNSLFLQDFSTLVTTGLISISLRLTFLIILYDFYKYELHTTATLGLFWISCILNYSFSTPLFTRVQNIFLFFGVFLAIYLFCKLRIYLRYHKNSEGFGFGDVLFSPVIGSFFPLFFPEINGRNRAIFFCIFIVIACILGILIYVCSFVKFFHKILLKSQKKSDLPITKIVNTTPIPFLPAMAISFLLLFICKNHLLTFFNFFL